MPVSLPANKAHTDRCMTIAIPNELPRSAVVIHLVVDNSGRSPAGRSNEAPADRSSPRGQARETGIRLVARAGARVAGSVPIHSSPSGAGAMPMADR